MGYIKEVQKALGFPDIDINTGAYEIKKDSIGQKGNP